jgi:PqqD family protein of HPr-rel-A system
MAHMPPRDSVQVEQAEPGHPTARAGVTLERVGAEAVLHDPRSGRAHVINGSAARLWELCDGSRDLNALSADFGASYGMDAALVRTDVEGLIAGLRSLGLLD